MSKTQIIKTEQGEELVVLTRREYDAMRARLGDEAAEDAMSVRIFEERAGAVAIPVAVWEEIEAAPSPVGPLRKWRKLTQAALATKAGISQPYLSAGAILTTAEIAADAAEEDHCGACRRCLDICPTHAFTAPYQIDARACISYLTIEHKGHIAPRYRAAMGNRIFGCDDCLAVCPWNKFAQAGCETKLSARPGSDNPPLAELLRLDDAAFRARFSGTPVKRTGRDRFMRNVLIAAGNSGDAGLVPLVEARLDDASPLVRAMAVWALARLAPRRFSALRGAHAAAETDQDVRSEWLEQAA